MSDAQRKTLRPATTRRSARMRRVRSSSGMSMARSSACGEALDVVGVDEERVGQLLRGAGQLAQHEHAAKVLARRDELLGDEVHAVVQRADDAEIGQTIERDEAAQLQRAFSIADRTVGRPFAVLGVELGDPFVDPLFERSVAANPRPRRHADLDERRAWTAARGRRTSRRSIASSRSGMPFV